MYILDINEILDTLFQNNIQYDIDYAIGSIFIKLNNNNIKECCLEPIMCGIRYYEYVLVVVNFDHINDTQYIERGYTKSYYTGVKKKFDNIDEMINEIKNIEIPLGINIKRSE